MVDYDRTIVAIHGNGGGSFRFSLLLPIVPENVHFVAVTLPGFAGVPLKKDVTLMTDLADLLYKGLMSDELPQGWLSSKPWHRLDKRPFILLGTGIGGSIALQYAQTYAEQLAGLILHAPVGTRLDRRWFPRLMRLPINRHIGKRLFTSRPLRPVWRKLLFIDPLPISIETQFFEEYRHCQLFGKMFDLINPAWFAGLQQISTPSVLLWGEEERVLTVDQLEDYTSLLNDPLIFTVPEWDHFPMLETPQHFMDVINALSKRIFVS